jgi:hypothetical protein
MRNGSTKETHGMVKKLDCLILREQKLSKHDL